MRKTIQTIILIITLISAAHATRIHVDQNATGSNDGTSWENAYKKLDWALKFTYDIDTVWIAQGVYTPDDSEVFNKNRESFKVTRDIVMIGGFKGSETALSQRDKSLRTTLSGELGDIADTTDNATHVLSVITKTFTIDGFIIRDGYGVSVNDNSDAAGAGILTYNNVDTLRVSNCDFENNVTNSHCHPSVREGGAAISLYDLDYVRITNSTFTNNRARNFYENNNNASGGALQLYNCRDVVIDSSHFEGNSADDEGGAICSGGRAIIKNSSFMKPLILF